MKIHMVKQGDTLYLIAKKYNVPLEELIKANPEISNPDELAIGTKVKIHSQPKSAFEVMHQHVVQQGDSLWKLSKAWGIHLADMIKANPQLKNPNALLTGEVVNIPKAGSAHQPTQGMQAQAIEGKAPTGVKPSTEVVPAPMPEPVPMPLPEPVPMPMPMPVAPVLPPEPVMPVQEIKPIYGAPHKDLFMQYPTPAVQAGSMAPDCPPEAVSPAFGYGHPSASPASTLPAYEGYGYGQPSVSPASTMPVHEGYGYGIAPFGGQIGGLGHMGGLGGYGGYGASTGHQGAFPGVGTPSMQSPGMVSPGMMPPGMVSPGMMPPGMVSPGMMSPEMAGLKPQSGCQSCGGQSAWPNATNMFPGMEYPGQVQPTAISPYEGYSYSAGPDVGGVQAGVGSYGGYPVQYGPYANVAGVTSPADMAHTGHGYSYSGAESYGYGGGFPPIPSYPSAQPLAQTGSYDGGYDERSSHDPSEDTQETAPVKSRPAAKAKKKANVARKNKPIRKESMPWINW